MDCIELSRANHFVLSKQHLVANQAGGGLEQVVADICGLHATSSTTPYLSLFARLPDFQIEQLNQALYERPVLAKIRCVRKTIFIHTAHLLPVFFQATADKSIKASEHFMIYRGVSKPAYEALSVQILALLRERPMTAAEIKEDLGTDLDISAVLYYMCDQGLLVRFAPPGGWKDRSHTYALFKEVLPMVNLTAIDEKEAAIRLVRHYLAAFGPVTENDIAWWTGFGKIRVRAALRSLGQEVAQVRICEFNDTMLVLGEDLDRIEETRTVGGYVVNLLPSLDPFIMGYTDRARYIEADYYDRVFDDSGNATNTILIDGQVKGVWDFEDGNPPLIKLHYFGYPIPGAMQQVSMQAGQLGRFIAGRDVRVRECKEMVPLTKRPAGSVMAPLKGC